MDHIWTLLELDPTADVAEIKHAYAVQAKKYHPEEHPDMFLKLRQAYQAALAYAQQHAGTEAVDIKNRRETNAQGDAASAQKNDDSAESESQAQAADAVRRSDVPAEDGCDVQMFRSDRLPDSDDNLNNPDSLDSSDDEDGGSEETGRKSGGWTLNSDLEQACPDLYREHEANVQFLALYTGAQRRNPKAWMDYFTSPAFLSVAFDSAFTRLLLDNVSSLAPEASPSREFQTWLSVAYQYSVSAVSHMNSDGTLQTTLHLLPHAGAEFSGIESVLEIASMGPHPKQLSGNEVAVQSSFREYRQLLRLAEQNGADSWSEQAINTFDYIVGRYVLAYIKDRCEHRQPVDTERHPAGLRVFCYFFEHHILPQELYRILWQKLSLQSAVMSRSKILFGRLRQIVVDHVPGIDQQAPEDFRALRTRFDHYALCCYQRSGSDPQKDVEETDALFAHKDFQDALQSRRFVEGDLLITGINDRRCDYFLERIIDFYTQHSDAPCASKVIQLAVQTLSAKRCAKLLSEDEEAPLPTMPLTLSFRPFLRHWLNTAFYSARHPETGQSLLQYCAQEFPYSVSWSSRFFCEEDSDGLPVPKCVSLSLGGNQLEVRFHRRYVDILINGQPMYQPVLDYNWLSDLTDDAFFFLLPMAAAGRDQAKQVYSQLCQRLGKTALPPHLLLEVAASLSDQVCRLPADSDEASPQDLDRILPFEIFAEDGEHLYGCRYFQNEETLLFFEQTHAGRRILPDGRYSDVYNTDSAILLSRQLLQETVAPSGIPMSYLENLPQAVYIAPDFMAISRDKERIGANMPQVLLNEAVTTEGLADLFSLLSTGKIKRLELSWDVCLPFGEGQESQPARSLIFLKETCGWACLYFDDQRAESFALLAQPERYWDLQDSHGTFVPFRQGKLMDYNIHRSFSSIRRYLDMVFRQASQPGGIDLHAGHMWTHAVNVVHGRHKYLLDKRLLGGFPAERACSRLAARLYLSAYPSRIVSVYSDDNRRECLPVGNRNRDRLQHAFSRLLSGELNSLQLTWATDSLPQLHIVLLHEQGRFLLALLSDQAQEAQFHVADKAVYMDVEGKKYPKATFRNRTIAAYLIHDSAKTLRSALELLLACIHEPPLVTDQFAEYAEETPVKPRPYEAIRAEFVFDEEI